jgi:glycosyltransferase involved in cell wall biosynthesis
MNLLVNLIPIKIGGGQQVADNFVTQVLKDQDIDPYFLVTENSFIHRKLEQKRVLKLFIVGVSLSKRFFFQQFLLKKIIEDNNIDLIYTLFGPGLHSSKVKSVTGCAYSNLFFPEIDFWKEYSRFERLKYKIIDYYRLKTTLKSHSIIFENNAMRKRAISLFNYPEKRTKLILPSISEYPEEPCSEELSSRLENINSKNFNILLLSGWAKNKNIHMIPNILNKLYLEEKKDVTFLITVSPNHPESVALRKRAVELGVEKGIIFFGSVLPTEVPFLYKNTSASILLSKLESFSNTIIESWYFKKPLIISDEEWSREICGSACVYVNRENAVDIAQKILLIKDNKTARVELEKRSVIKLEKYPSPQQKIVEQLNFLRQTAELII